jgi:ADP-ribosyl-[dinitrogen reductase] hydrolase
VSAASGDVLGCLLGGAIGDALGGVAERGRLCLSDDTQLTLATCEAILAEGEVAAPSIAATFRSWFATRRLSGLGSSTLKALRDLEAGAHWGIAGARGEMAAGNGGAMRVAPLAFVLDATADRQMIRDVVSITHRNDEAYLGALAVVVALQYPASIAPSGLLQGVAAKLPDSRVRDNLVAVGGSGLLEDLAGLAEHFGCSGYVVETVPLALAAGWHMVSRGMQPVLEELVAIGGDTDTIASIAGQIAGARLGGSALPDVLVAQLPERVWVTDVASRFSKFVESRLTRVSGLLRSSDES